MFPSLHKDSLPLNHLGSVVLHTAREERVYSLVPGKRQWERGRLILVVFLFCVHFKGIIIVCLIFYLAKILLIE